MALAIDTGREGFSETPDLSKIFGFVVPVFPLLDASFQPCARENRKYRESVEMAKSRGIETDHIVIALQRENGFVSRHEFDVLALDDDPDGNTRRYVERTLKFLLWSRGARKIYFSGPEDLGLEIKESYSPGGDRAFDAELMGNAYSKGGKAVFEVDLLPESEIPGRNESATRVGGHTDGCRLGFDLGASDVKVALMIDGEVVWSDEFKWNLEDEMWFPKTATDPGEHLRLIIEKLDLGLEELEKRAPGRSLDAIGGSTAGIVVDNLMMVSSLFQGVQKLGDESLMRKARNIFLDIGEHYGVPIRVLNDGDVTALSGALSLGRTAVLGIAMGSSEAAGYIDRNGSIKGWLNELAFAPVDYSPDAQVDPWSLDRGVGARYFSQEGVRFLAIKAGFDIDEKKPSPEVLREIAAAAEDGDERALLVFRSIGVYLGYTVAHYADFYDFDSLLVLGRVVSGRGGDEIIETARAVLEQEFPELADKIELIVPEDSRLRRVGQAGAAATIPEIGGS